MKQILKPNQNLKKKQETSDTEIEEIEEDDETTPVENCEQIKKQIKKQAKKEY